MAAPFGSANVTGGAIDIDSPEFAAQFGDGDEGSQVAPDDDFPISPESFDPPADFAGGIEELPDIIHEAQGRKAMTRKSQQSAKEKAAAQKAREKAKAQKAAEAAKKKLEREQAREKAKAEKAAARAAGPDLTGLVPTKPAQRATLQNVAIELLDGIDGGDPVERAFVENVKLNGVMTPIRVRQTEDGRFNIIYGKRRSQAARAAGFSTIPAVVEKDSSANDYVQGLAENYSRSNNVIEEHRMVMALIDHFREQLGGDAGANDRKAVAAISKATGMTVAQIKKARDVGRLVPELFVAVEEGAMSSWSALNASRLPVEAQRRLVEILDTDGKVTAEDVVIARRHKQHEAVAETVNAASASGQDMYGEPGDDAPESGIGSQADSGDVREMSRTEKVAAAVVLIRRGMDILSGLSAKSDDEKDAITLAAQIIENLTTAAG